MGKIKDQEGDHKTAIMLYAKAKQYRLAVNLAMKNELDHEILQYSIPANKPVQLKSARYFEDKGYNEKAINLYLRAREVKKALDMAV